MCFRRLIWVGRWALKGGMGYIQGMNTGRGFGISDGVWEI